MRVCGTSQLQDQMFSALKAKSLLELLPVPTPGPSPAATSPTPGSTCVGKRPQQTLAGTSSSLRTTDW